MKKIASLFTGYFKNRGFMFFVGLVVALLSIASGVVYYTYLKPLSNYLHIWILILPIIGAACYLFFSLIRLPRWGAVDMTILNFAALLGFILTIYSYPMGQMMTSANLLQVPYFINILVVAILMIVSTILSNVVSWTRLEKKKETIKEGK